MEYTFETAGQHFVQFLRDRHLAEGQSDGPSPLDGLWRVLLPTARPQQWVTAIQEMAALQLAHRLIVAGCQIAAAYHGSLDVAAERDIKQAILDTMIIDYQDVADLFVRLEPAIRAARREVSDGLRKAIEGFARREMSYCYLCGSDLDFVANAPTSFTVDHVWPRAYGGDSVEENLLPACRSCNERKDKTPSWAIYPVQALVAGFRLDDEGLARMPKEMRFAVQTFEAQRHAAEHDTSLRDAFLGLGRPALPSVADESVSVDVFNLVFQTA